MLKPSLVSLERKVGAMINSDLAILPEKLNQKIDQAAFWVSGSIRSAFNWTTLFDFRARSFSPRFSKSATYGSIWPGWVERQCAAHAINLNNLASL